jgi:hypothetical protein
VNSPSGEYIPTVTVAAQPDEVWNHMRLKMPESVRYRDEGMRWRGVAGGASGHTGPQLDRLQTAPAALYSITTTRA